MKTNYFYKLILIITGVIMTASCGKLNQDTKDSVLLFVKDDPTVSFRIWFKVGSQNDPMGKEGIAALTAELLTNGSTTKNKFENIIEKLYPIASSYGATVDKEMTVIYGRTHKDNLDVFYNLLMDAILHPAFKQEEFERIKTDMINSIEKDLRYASDEELGKAALYEFVFAGTPYAHLTEGTVESLKSITLDDVKKFYKTNYTSSNYVLGLAGGFEDVLTDKLAKDLATLPEGKPATVPVPLPQKIDGLDITIVEKPSDATAISFGFPIKLLRNDDDFAALALFNSWFGEHRNSLSHLYQFIRETRGMNYGDYSYIEAFLNGGSLDVPNPNNCRRQQLFEVWLRPVQNQNRHFVLRAAIRELQKVAEHGLTKEQFELTKKFLYNYCLFYAPTTMMKLGYQLDSKFYGVKDNGDYITYFRNKINSLTLDQVNAAIKKYLQFDNIKIAIVTENAEKFKEDLTSNAPSPITYMAPVPESVSAEDKMIENYFLKIKPEKVKIVKVDNMFQK